MSSEDIRSSESSSTIVTSNKQTANRKRIVLEKIQNKQSLQVTFSKRRKGLFKKAAQFSGLCGAEVAIVAFSPYGRPYTFGHPSVDSIISRLESARAMHVCMHDASDDNDGDSTGSSTIVQSNSVQSNNSAYQTTPDKINLGLRLGMGAGAEDEIEEEDEVGGNGGGFWWDRTTENMNLQELKEFRDSLKGLKNNVATYLDEKSMRESAIWDFLGLRW